MKKIVKYSDVKIIKGKTTTVVIGTARTNLNRESVIAHMLYSTADKFNDFNSDTHYYKGVAYLSPKDTYDEKTGIVLASRKAEAKSNLKVLKNYKTAIKMLSDALILLNADASQLESELKVLNDKIDSYK
jgi:hypothetical protein